MPYGPKARYKHDRQRSPTEFYADSFRTVPLHHTKYRGKKYAWYKRKKSGARAVVARSKKTKKWGIQSILIPKTKAQMRKPRKPRKARKPRKQKVKKNGNWKKSWRAVHKGFQRQRKKRKT
jgi:hypothetical protein